MKELLEMIGKSGAIPVGKMTFDVTITNVKRSYGNDRYEVEPVAGSGRDWVEKITLE